MDILQTIKIKSSGLSENNSYPGISAAILHIEVAERYLNEAHEKNDDNKYTDIIYRCNQAFEGILKEAYTVLANKEACDKKPYDIENYLIENKILKERVVELLKNYRTEWRNKSVHDHKLFFTEQEAFLAIISVSAFISILLDQVLGKLFYNKEKDKAQKNAQSVKNSIDKYDSLTDFDKIVALLETFALEKWDDGPFHPRELSEVEMVALLHGYLNGVEPSLHVITEPKMDKNNVTLRPDFIVNIKTTQLIIEIKRYVAKNYSKSRLDASLEQLATYLDAFTIDQGILLYYPISTPSKMKKEIYHKDISDQHITMTLMVPE